MRPRILIACFTFLLVACQSSPTPTAQPTLPSASSMAAPAGQFTATPVPQPTAPVIVPRSAPTARASDTLYVEVSNGTGLAVVDAATGERLRTLPRGVPALDWSILYTAECQANKTVVSAVATASGQTVASRSLDGCYSLPSSGVVGVGGLSPHGNWLALASRSASQDSATATPGYQGQSRFVVLDTKFAREPLVVNVNGRFSYDAVDDGGTSLYLIEDLPAETPAPIGTRYQVRRYDLTTKSLDPGAIADKSNAEPIMAGLRQTSIASRDGQWLYSLYLNNVSGPFIHALNLDNRFAICLDLPTASKADVEKQMLWTLTMSPDGRRLFAANGALGLIAQVDPANAVILHTAELPRAAVATPASRARSLPSLALTAEAKRRPAGGAAITSDGKMLLIIGDNGLLSIGVDDLQLHGRFLPDLSLRSIVASPERTVVYVVPDEPTGRILQINPASGAILLAKDIGNLWGILGIESGPNESR